MKGKRFLFLIIILLASYVFAQRASAEASIPQQDQTPLAPLSKPNSPPAQPRYISGFGLNNAYTIFYEDRAAAGCVANYPIYFNQTSSGALGLAATSTATDMCDSHVLVKNWAITIGPMTYAYRAWGAGSYSGSHNFYVSNNLVNWTLVATFTFDHPSDGILYGFHDIIQLNGHYIGFVESAGGHTYIVSSSSGDQNWTVVAEVGGSGGSDAPLNLSFTSDGPIPTGDFLLMEVGGQIVYGKLMVPGNHSGAYLAINRAAAQAATPAAAEAAFLNPANWTWADGSTGLPGAGNRVLISTLGAGGHDIHETWTIPSSNPLSGNVILYTANYASIGDAPGIGCATGNPQCLVDATPPSVISFTLKVPATSPTNADTLVFLATFSEAVTGVDTADFSRNGTTTATVTNVTQVTASTYDVTISGGDLAGFNGIVGLDLSPTPTITDLAGNALPAGEPAIDQTYTVDNTALTVLSTSLAPSYTTGPIDFTVTFDEDVYDPPGNTDPDDVTNPANYLLIDKGPNGTADTLSCKGGVLTDDTQIGVSSVTYDSATFTATVSLNGALPAGSYRLFVCGTTSIVDLAHSPLAGNGTTPGTDYTFDFPVSAASGGKGSEGAKHAQTLPLTGFAPNTITSLPPQPAELAYTTLGSLSLEIPSQNVKSNIVGVPQSGNAWDVTWLGSEVGWLNGTAFPTWSGNSVLTGHVWNADNTPGVFVHLKNLKYSDQIKIHAFGQLYIYEVSESRIIRPSQTDFVFQHEERPYLTLLTCEDYHVLWGNYSLRRMVRAVLVEVQSQ